MKKEEEKICQNVVYFQNFELLNLYAGEMGFFLQPKNSLSPPQPFNMIFKYREKKEFLFNIMEIIVCIDVIEGLNKIRLSLVRENYLLPYKRASRILFNHVHTNTL